MVLYCHGGGYVFGSTRSHFAIARRLSRESGLAVFLLDYRLAPEHVFPAAADDALAAYTWMLDAGVKPANITVAGDSAGGHLVGCLLGDLAREGLPHPAAVLLMSPALDLSGQRAVARNLVCLDPLLSTGYGLRCFDAYLAGTHPLHPRLAVLSAPKAGWRPTLIQAGGTECLLGDAEGMAESLREAGVECELQVWPGQVHVFRAFSRWLPEARAALRSGRRFLRGGVEAALDAPFPAARPVGSRKTGGSKVSGE